MKKLLVLFLAVVLVFSFAFTASAAGFVQSPSNNDAPVLEEATNEDEDCTAKIVITSYADRDKIPEDIRQQMEEIYKQISQATDISSLSDELKEYCEQNGIDTNNLAVSDLFDVSYVDCGTHDADGHGYFSITLKAETLENFVALLSYKDGKYSLVKDAKVSGGTKLSFKIDEVTPLAIVVDTSVKTDKPTTGDTFNLNLWSAILAISVISLFVVVFLGYKRKKA